MFRRIAHMKDISLQIYPLYIIGVKYSPPRSNRKSHYSPYHRSSGRKWKLPDCKNRLDRFNKDCFENEDHVSKKEKDRSCQNNKNGRLSVPTVFMILLHMTMFLVIITFYKTFENYLNQNCFMGSIANV